jgi:DNA (cytosine-5)-methyltransferase 1
VVCGNAHKFLEDNWKHFDFIWSSPPCPSHGQYRHNVGVLGKGFAPILPDMKLYAEIVFLQTYCKCKWVVENTRPYYTPLIAPAFVLQRHLFWANFTVPHKRFATSMIRSKNKISDFEDAEAVAKSAIKNKRQVLWNCVDPALGLYIFESATRQGKNWSDLRRI